MDKYISKTKFEELMHKKSRNYFDLYYADKIRDHYNKAVGYSIAADEASVFPSADVQPVKHGEWIPQGDEMWLCSQCKNNIIYSMSKLDRSEKQRYCSRCGARMDLKDGDAE